MGPGKHRIKVELPGYQTFETEVTLLVGQKSEVKTILVKGSIEQAGSLIKQPIRKVLKPIGCHCRFERRSQNRGITGAYGQCEWNEQ